MRKLLLFLVLTTSVMSSQETCESPEESLAELNSITKCSIEPSKKSNNKKPRQISVKVSASKKRFLKKRVAQKKNAVSSLNNLNTSGVSNANKTSEISNTVTLEKQINTATIASLSNKLSADEVRKASKFNVVDEIPLFSACEKTKKKERLDCFNTEMIKHIQKHFDYPNEAIISKTQGDVWVRFIIDKDGNVTNIKTLGPQGGKILDQEAIRVVSKLPKFIPGKLKGTKTSVKYGFPISFSLEE